MKIVVAKSKDWKEKHLLEDIPVGSVVVHTGDPDIEAEARRLGLETRAYPIEAETVNTRNSNMLRREMPLDLVRVFTHNLKRSRELNDLIDRARFRGVRTDVRS